VVLAASLVASLAVAVPVTAAAQEEPGRLTFPAPVVTGLPDPGPDYLDHVTMVETADLDGDGIDDVVYFRETRLPGSTYRARAGAMLGRSDGTFEPSFETTLPAAASNASGNAIVDDITGDGELDLIVGGQRTPEVRIHAGNGDGTFAEDPQLVPVPASPGGNHPGVRFVRTADLDGDGHTDLVAAAGHGQIVVLLADGEGGFGDPQVLNPEAANLSSIALIDVDGDERPEIVLGTVNHLHVLDNDGDGGFSPGVRFPGGGATDNFAAVVGGDFNGNGNVDLVVARTSFLDMTLLSGNGDGTFVYPPFTEAVPVQTIQRRDTNRGLAQDIDGDGHLDIAFGGQNQSALVGFGDGQGRFELTEWLLGDPEQDAGTFGQTVRNVALADLGVDGRLDLVGAIQGAWRQAGNGLPQIDAQGGIHVARSDPDDPRAWRAARGYPTDNRPGERIVRLADWNGDGHLDALMNTFRTGLDLYEADGDGTFAARPRNIATTGLAVALGQTEAEPAEGRAQLEVAEA
jgi:hypothetical protein